MEYSENAKKLARYRNSLRAPAIDTSGARKKSDGSSNLEMLGKILERLPESQKAQYEHFRELLRNRSHSPESARLKKKKKAFTLVPATFESRTRAYSGHDLDNIRSQKNERPMFEVDLTQFNSPQDFFYALFIGDFSSANDCSLLVKYSIQGIVTIGAENVPEMYPNVTNGYFCVKKCENFVADSMKTVTNTLDYMLKNGNTLIHCKDGNSFAPVIAIAYLIKKFNLIYSIAKESVCKNHPSFLISSKYESELIQYERYIHML